MAKILLVEDDSNLREIYGARLEAEGYEIISASDGEEALAIAVRERPDLIISDVMMPKISGFDMLDILRSTPETKDVKVIVMTALSQEEDRQRGEKLGADRYVVKSQVTLDDIVIMVRDILEGTAQYTTDSTAETPAQASQTPENAAQLADEIQDFVNTSPLMGAAPQPQQEQAPQITQQDNPGQIPVTEAPVAAAAPIETVEPQQQPQQPTQPQQEQAPTQPNNFG